MSIAGQVQEMALVQTVVRNGYEVVVDSLQLAPSFGAYYYTNLDLGTPSIDAVATPFTNTSGTYDQSKFTRERAVAITFTLLDNWFPPYTIPSPLNTSGYWARQMAKWTNPAMRCYLYVRHSGAGAPVYRIDLRGVGLTQAISTTDRTNRFVQMQFVSPSGLLRQMTTAVSDTDTTVTYDGRVRQVVGYNAVGSGGLVFPITFPVTFPGDNGVGIPVVYGGSFNTDRTIFTGNGAIPTGFIARIHAVTAAVFQPKLNFTLTDPTGYTGPTQSIGFQSSSNSFQMVPVGHYLEINTELMTARLDGDPLQPMEAYLLGPLRWPRLFPGSTNVEFTTNLNADLSGATSPGAGSYTEILYYPAFL